MTDLKSNNSGQIQNDLGGKNSAENLVRQTQNNIINNIQRQSINPEQLRMNNLASIDRAVYIKDLLNLPKNMVELLVLVQKNQNLQQPNQPQLPNQPQQPQQLNQPQFPQQGQQSGQQGQGGQQQGQGGQNQGMPNPPNIPRPLLPTGQPTFNEVQQNIQQTQTNLNHPVLPNQPQPQKPVLPNQPQLPQPPQPGENGPQPQEMLQTKQQQILNSQIQRQTRNNSILDPHSQMHQSIRDRVRRDFDARIMQLPSAEETVVKNTQQNIKNDQLTQLKQNLAQQLDNNVNISRVSALLQQNSKVALNKMVLAMSMATRQGMSDVRPLQETINIINASISATSDNNSTQTLKNLMLLYLPWLPLQDGVGFDLDIEESEEGGEKSETFIKILIATRNYGNLHATVSLLTGNSVDVEIICSDKFPEKELRKRLRKDSDQHSMQSAIDIIQQKPMAEEEVLKPKAKVNLSNVETINPYLLLICHSIIRHVIELDSIVSLGTQPIED